MYKKFYESKLVATGYIVIAISILSFIYNEEWVQEYPKIVPIIGTTIGVLVVVFRYLTSKPMELSRRLKQELQVKGWRK